MAFFRTDAVTVSKPDPAHGSGSGLAFTIPVDRNVNLQPMAAVAAYEMFGVEATNPYVLYDEASAAAEYEIHGRVFYGSQTFAIKAVPRKWNTFAGLAHVQVLLEEIRES